MSGNGSLSPLKALLDNAGSVNCTCRLFAASKHSCCSSCILLYVYELTRRTQNYGIYSVANYLVLLCETSLHGVYDACHLDLYEDLQVICIVLFVNARKLAQGAACAFVRICMYIDQYRYHIICSSSYVTSAFVDIRSSS